MNSRRLPKFLLSFAVIAQSVLAVSPSLAGGSGYCSEDYVITDDASIWYSSALGFDRVAKNTEIRYETEGRRSQKIIQYHRIFSELDRELFNSMGTYFVQILPNKNSPRFGLLAKKLKNDKNNETYSEDKYPEAEVYVLRQGANTRDYQQEIIRPTNGVIRQFGNKKECFIARVDNGYEIEKSVIQLPRYKSKFEDLRCLYTGLMIYLGANDFEEVYSKRYHRNDLGSEYSFLWSLLAEISSLYDRRIMPGMNREEVLEVLRQRSCAN